MRLTVDLDSLELISAAGDRRRVTLKEFKRGDATPFEVQFVRSGVAEALPVGAVLAFGLKESKKYDGDFAVFFDSFAAPTASPNFIYAGTPNFNTEELNDLLFVDGTTSNDKAFVDLMGELSWAVAEADPVSIRTFTARVHNDVIRGDEGTPLAIPTPIDWLAAHGIVYDPAIIGLTGGTSEDLDGIDTVGASVPRLQAVNIAGLLYLYQLTEDAGLGAEDENSPRVILPDDRNPGTNPKVWILLSVSVESLQAWTEVSAPLLTLTYGPFSAGLSAQGITAFRTQKLFDRSGTLLPFIEIDGNISDNAGIAEVAADTLGLVIRNQDTDDWHQVTIRDSGLAGGGAASGIPTFVYSDPL